MTGKALLFIGAFAALILLPAAYLTVGNLRQSDEDPAQVLESYLTAVYARDYRAAYKWISVEDRRHKREVEYLRENPPFSAATLELTRKLAEVIELRDLRTHIEGNRAKLSFLVRLPDANAPALRCLFFDFDNDRLDRLSAEEIQKLKEKLELLRTQGNLPMIEGEDSLELVREQGKWRVSLEWAGAIRVRFVAEVKEGLRWEFRPLQETVLAKPGETLQAVYKAKNLSNRPITAKARHLDEPREQAQKYLEIIQCFCFIQITLAPGEEKELPLVFRVHWDTPRNVKEFRVTYDFYPIEKFPETELGGSV